MAHRPVFLPLFCAGLTPLVVLLALIFAWQRPHGSELGSLALAVGMFGSPVAFGASLAAWPLLAARARQGLTLRFVLLLAMGLGALALPGFLLGLRSLLGDSFGPQRPLEETQLLEVALIGAPTGVVAGLVFWFTGGRLWSARR